MDLKQIVLLAVQVSIWFTVIGFGLKASSQDLLYVFRRPGLLARSLAAVFVLMPLVAVALAQMFHFVPTVRIALIALAISPVPPLLPMKTKAGGDSSFAIGLMATLGLFAIVAVPVALEILERVFGRQLGMAPSAVAGVVLKSVLAPLGLGAAVRAILPSLAKRLEKPVDLIAKVLLPIAVLPLLIATFPAVWALIGDGTVLAIVIFTLAGLAIGHILGGPNPDHSVVLATATACRHPAIAFGIAASNFPDLQFGGAILLYILVNAIACIPYLKWQQKGAVVAVSPTPMEQKSRG